MSYTVDRLGNHHSQSNGRFIPKASRGPKEHSLRTMTGRLATALEGRPTRELNRLLRDIRAEPKRAGRAQELQALAAELARRKGVKQLKARDDRRSKRVDQLIARGMSYTDAYAEAHGLNVKELAQAQRDALVDAERRPGERREQTLRRMYHEYVAAEVFAAEEATRGVLLSREAEIRNARAGRAGARKVTAVRPSALWTGNPDTARKYASEELKRWWESRGGRMTWEQFRAQYVGTAKQRQGRRQAGTGRDFGL
jgi:hypothetical protein